MRPWQLLIEILPFLPLATSSFGDGKEDDEIDKAFSEEFKTL